MTEDRGPKLVAGPAMTGPSSLDGMSAEQFEQRRRQRQAEGEAIDHRNRTLHRLLRNVVEGKPDVVTAAGEFFAFARTRDVQ